MIQCHECGVYCPLYICPFCLIPLSVPVPETWDDLLDAGLRFAGSSRPGDRCCLKVSSDA